MKKSCSNHHKIYTISGFIISVLLTSFTISDDDQLKSADVNDLYDFTHVFISENLPTVQLNGAQTLADYDNDGDLDMTIGSLGYGLYLMKNNGTDWAPVKIGNLPYTALGAAAIDVNNDGWVDLIAAGVWYENNLGTDFTMHHYDTRFKSGDHFHDIVMADINNDGKKDLVGMGDDIGFFWYEIWADPMGNWTRTTIDPNYPDPSNHVHGGFSPAGVGDLDGDGDNDVFRANAWFENQNNGSVWIKHPVTFEELFTGNLPYGKSTRSVIIDIDDDGDNDIVFTTCDDVDGKAGFMENLSGNGSEWALNLFPQTAIGRRGSLHSLQVADLDGDGKLEVITADQEDMIQPGMPSPRWYVFYQTEEGWEEQVLFEIGLGSHELFARDVDQDGDFDLAGKNWYPWGGNATYGTSHADYFENHSIDQNPHYSRLSTNVNSAWTQTGGKWEQLGDYIIGEQDINSSQSGGLLLTKQKFGDFEIVCDVWPDYGVDSGIFLRTDDDGKKAYQVTIDYQENNPMGGIYLSGMDASANWDFTIKNEDEIEGNPQFFNKNAWSYIWKKNDWNQFRVRVESNPPVITTWINGYKVNEYTDNLIRLPDEGKIGLQVHTGNDWEEGKIVRFKNIKVYPLTQSVNEILKDTVLKINFTKPEFPENGWSNVTKLSDFPLLLNNGVYISFNGNNLIPGKKSESVTVFSENVGKTFCLVKQSNPVNIKIHGLNPEKKYFFDIFSSIDEHRESDIFFSVNNDTVSIDPSGNKDSVLFIKEIIPDANGEVFFNMFNENDSIIINALVVSRIMGKMYSLNVETDGNGSVSQTTGTFEEGTVINLSAIPEDGWMFENWSGDINSTNPEISVEMNTDKYIEANFSETPDPNTIAQINFTVDETWDVGGWRSVYGSSSFPVNLGNGVTIDISGGILKMGISGESISSVVPDKVSNTYNWLSNIDNTPVDLIFNGLEPNTKYTFNIFASRDAFTSSGDRTTTFSITGTDKVVSINPVGNRDSLLIISGIEPSLSGEVILHIAQLSGQYGYINGLVISKDVYTSMNESNSTGDIRYYPIPVTDKLHITNLPGHNQILIYNVSGNKVLEKMGGENQEILMSGFTPGLYFLKIVSPLLREAKNFKIVKK